MHVQGERLLSESGRFDILTTSFERSHFADRLSRALARQLSPSAFVGFRRSNRSCAQNEVAASPSGKVT